MGITLTTRRNLIPLLPGILNTRMKAAVDTTAENIRTRAYQMAPRDTGSLAESLYVSKGDADNSDYSQHAARAQTVNPRAVIVPEVMPSLVISLSGVGGPSSYIAIIGAAVSHGIFQELGTRYMAPQPFMFPAIEPERSNFVSIMGGIVDV